MFDAIDDFLSRKICDAADSTVGTNAYKKINDVRLSSMDKLKASLPKEQMSLFLEVLDATSQIDCIISDAIYKAAFLEGYAAGRIVGGDRE
jgi:hypothetical protein